MNVFFKSIAFGISCYSITQDNFLYIFVHYNFYVFLIRRFIRSEGNPELMVEENQLRWLGYLFRMEKIRLPVQTFEVVELGEEEDQQQHGNIRYRWQRPEGV